MTVLHAVFSNFASHPVHVFVRGKGRINVAPSLVVTDMPFLIKFTVEDASHGVLEIGKIYPQIIILEIVIKMVLWEDQIK